MARTSGGLLHRLMPAVAGCAKSHNSSRILSQSSSMSPSASSASQGPVHEIRPDCHRHCVRWRSMHVHVPVLLVSDCHALRQVAASQGNKGSKGLVNPEP